MFKKLSAAAAVFSPVAVFAALPAGVDTAITGVTTDGSTLIGYMALAGATVYLISKLLKRFGVML